MLRAAFRFFAALLVVVPAVWFFLVALSPSYNSCIQNNGQHATEQYTSDGQQIVEGPIDNPTAFHLALVCGSNFANRNGEAFTGLFTIALTAATFLLGLLAWDQGQTTRAQLRAYLNLRLQGIETGPEKGYVVIHKVEQTGRWLTHIRVKNVGQTPAFEVLGETYMGICPEPLPEKFTVDFSHMPMIASKIVLFPQSESALLAITSEAFSQEQISAIQQDNSGVALYIFARVSYRDTFGVDYWTESASLVEQQHMKQAIRFQTHDILKIRRVSVAAQHNGAT